MATDTETKWKLIYHGGFPGRGEYVRLIFEEAGVPYEDVGNAEGGSEVVMKYMQGKVVDGMPVQYPPIIEKGSFRLCQTPAIIAYLGKKFGLYPDNPEDEARCLQINLVLADYVAEVHDAYHPVEKSATYASQADVAKDHIARLIEKRMPR
jgi:glutathione S-transferase